MILTVIGGVQVASAVAAVEAAAPYGLHTIAGVPVFLKYYASAPRVTDPQQWGLVQTSLQNDLSITLRDPFTFGPRQSVGAVETDAAPDDQCPRGLALRDHLGALLGHGVVQLLRRGELLLQPAGTLKQTSQTT